MTVMEQGTQQTLLDKTPRREIKPALLFSPTNQLIFSQQIN
jgi:hypothetical protein